jgi:hypothetical protein
MRSRCKTLNIGKGENRGVAKAIPMEGQKGAMGTVGLRPFDATTSGIQVAHGPVGHDGIKAAGIEFDGREACNLL